MVQPTEPGEGPAGDGTEEDGERLVGKVDFQFSMFPIVLRQFIVVLFFFYRGDILK